MSRNAKIVLGIAGGLLFLCICVTGGGLLLLRSAGDELVDAMIVEDPAEAAAIGREIVDYDLPRGYREHSAMDFFFMRMVLIAREGWAPGDASTPLITLAELPFQADLDTEEARQQTRDEILRSARDQDYDLELVSQRTITLRGQEVPLLVYEGVDEDGIAIRQIVAGFFEGKSGQVQLVILGSQDHWDARAVQAFLESVR